MDKKKPTPDMKDNSEKPIEKEIGGFEDKLEPTRYGDWEVNGRCSDF